MKANSFRYRVMHRALRRVMYREAYRARFPSPVSETMSVQAWCAVAAPSGRRWLPAHFWCVREADRWRGMLSGSQELDDPVQALGLCRESVSAAADSRWEECQSAAHRRSRRPTTGCSRRILAPIPIQSCRKNSTYRTGRAGSPIRSLRPTRSRNPASASMRRCRRGRSPGWRHRTETRRSPVRARCTSCRWRPDRSRLDSKRWLRPDRQAPVSGRMLPRSAPDRDPRSTSPRSRAGWRRPGSGLRHLRR